MKKYFLPLVLLVLSAAAAAAVTTSADITITVQPAQGGGPTAALSASPTSIAPGGSTTLTWSSTNVTACNGYGGLATIVDAINALPGGGGTVIVGDGIWATSSTSYFISRGNFNLVGNSLSAIIRPVGTGKYIWISGGSNVRVSAPN